MNTEGTRLWGRAPLLSSNAPAYILNLFFSSKKQQDVTLQDQVTIF
jgi:hypothetical protein